MLDLSKIEVRDVVFCKHRGNTSREMVFKGTVTKIRKNGWFDVTTEAGNKVTYSARGEEVGTGKWGYGCLIDEPTYVKMLAAQDLRVRIQTATRMASDLAKWDGRDKVGYLARIDKFRAFVEGC